eukprot:scaffold185608_cov15-Prasinocladus_malaysianus.AAC.1
MPGFTRFAWKMGMHQVVVADMPCDCCFLPCDDGGMKSPRDDMLSSFMMIVCLPWSKLVGGQIASVVGKAAMWSGDVRSASTFWMMGMITGVVYVTTTIPTDVAFWGPSLVARERYSLGQVVRYRPQLAGRS